MTDLQGADSRFRFDSNVEVQRKTVVAAHCEFSFLVAATHD